MGIVSFFKKKAIEKRRVYEEGILAIKDFTSETSKLLNKIEQSSLANLGYAREFHRLLLNEYAKYPQNKVYGMIYLNTTTMTDRRILLISANTLEIAQQTADEILKREGFTLSNWVVETYQSLDIPLVSENVTNKLDSQMNVSEKPVGVFVNDLKLVSDRFCSSKQEKSMINKIIEKIETQYNKVENK